MREIAQILCGSHLYGCDLDTSDLDFKIVYVPTARNILLQQADRLEEEEMLAAIVRLKKAMRKHGYSIARDPDIEFMSLRQYLKLLCQGQTNAMDMLFAPDEFHLATQTVEWYVVKFNAAQFISRNSASFVGYCRDQVKKYAVKQDRFQAVEAVVKYLQAVELKSIRLRDIDEPGDPSLTTFVNLNPYTELVILDTAQGGKLAHLSVCQTMVPITATVKVALETFEHKLKGYGERVRANEEMGAEDWKSLYHAVRVAHEAIELMETGQLTFPRPERNLLKAIRLGKIPFDRVTGLIEENLALVEKAVANSKLPEQPNWKLADDLVMAAYKGAVALAHLDRHASE